MTIQRVGILNRIVRSGLVVVVRAESRDQAVGIADACAAGGVSALEITFTVPGASRIIEDLAARYRDDEMVIGAGTVLDPETARIALLSGARFVVSPALSAATARLCNRYQIPYLPGVATVKDIIESLECGADIVKLFPCDTLGPEFIALVKGPLPYASLLPTGTVGLENAAAWIAAGSVAVGVGSRLTRSAKTGDYGRITELSRQLIETIREARAR